MAISLVSGVWLVSQTNREWGDLSLKAGLVLVAIILAGLHQLTAAKSTPAQRGAMQGVILLVSLGIFAVATGL